MVIIIVKRIIKERDFHKNLYVFYIHFILVSLYDEPEHEEYLSEALFQVHVIVKNNRFKMYFFFNEISSYLYISAHNVAFEIKTKPF